IDHREHSVRVQLDPLPPTGVVLVQSDPSGAYAWIDGEGGLTTPARFTDVAEGVHQLKVEMPGWLSQEQAIEVRSAEETSLSVKLVSRKVSYFLEAIAREPQKLSNYTELGRIYFLEGEIDKVFEMLRRGFVTLALSGHPPDKGFRELLRLATNADPDLQSERWRQFLAEMRQGIQDVHPYSLALPYAFSLLARAEQWKEVADLSTRFLERDPRARPFYVWRMQARGRLGDTQGVAQDIQRLRDLGLISAQPVLIPSARGTNVPDLGWVSAMWAAALARVQLNDLAGADELIRPFESQTNVHYWTESIRGERWLRDRRGDPPKPWLEARRCTQPPAIDGRLDDPAWTSAARGHRFYHWLTDQPSQLGSVVRAGVFDSEMTAGMGIN
ncbi:MAG: PEGA domain-containing protein, partial [Armatimonadetes bacterium]|nr:PEGA domain-containing protein [Armatimonadota bacterium]